MSVFLRISFMVAAIIFLTTAMSMVQGAPTQSLRSGAQFSGTDGTCKWYKAGDPDWIFQRFTYLMGYADCPGSISEWRTKSPGCHIVFYTSGTDLGPAKSYSSNNYVFSGKPTYIRNRLVQLGDIEENAYMHFYNDTKIRNWTGTTWDTLLIPGTNSMAITAKDSVSRAVNSYTSYLFTSRNTYTYPTRLAPNFANARMRLAYKEYITLAFTSERTTYWPLITGYWDGMFWDNYGPTAMQGGHLVSGGLVVETGTSPANLLTYASTAYAEWCWVWMKTFGREVRDTLRTSAAWSADRKKKVLAYNIGISHRDEYLYPDSVGADALVVEWGFDPVASPNNSYYRLENIHARDSIATLNGVTYFWISNPRTTYTTKRQSIYNNLCFYYVARTDSTWMAIYPTPGNSYGAFCNTGFDTLSWIPAMGYDLGVPIAHYQLVTSGTSPDMTGAQYKVWMRDYQEGRVYIRPKDDLNTDKWGSTSTPVTVSLGGTYKQLNTDGTLGSVITSLSLHAAEGAIVIPVATGACATPPSVPTLSSPADGVTVASRTPSICVNNSTQSGSCAQSIIYDFQVSTVSGFGTVVSENSSVAQGSSTTCWTVAATLNPGQLYYWRVRAGNGTSWSSWSATRKFVTRNSAPTVPTLSAPATGATMTSLQPILVIVNSTDPEGATPVYHFQLSTLSSFSSIAVENLSVAQGPSMTTWQVTPALSNLTTYYWRVRASDGQAYSAWSGSRSFYVNQPSGNNPPTAPTCSSPTSGAKVSNLTPDLISNNAVDPNGDPLTYQFELYNASFSTQISQSPMITQGSGSTTTWRVPVTLSQKTIYTWRTRAYDSQAWSNWMTLASFRTNRPPQTPIPRTPVSDTVFGSVHVLVTNNTTDPDGDTLTYDFVVYSDSLLTKQVEIGLAIPQGVSYTSFTTSGSYTNNKPYWWRVRAYDGGAWCNWSDPKVFWHFDMALDAADAPTLVRPADGSTETNVKPQFQVTWSGSGSSVCQFDLATDAGFSTIIDGGSVVGDQGAAVWTANRPLENGQTYHWRVKREQSGYSQGAVFSVSANIYLSPVPFSYLDGNITIHNLPPASRFEVYTPSGDKVVELDNLSGDYSWNVLNSNGEQLGSGVFLYYIRFNDKTVADKFIVVR